jgi:hypothetical protein
MTAEIDTFETEFVPEWQAWKLLGALVAAVAVLLTVSILLPHDRYVRYQQLTDSDLFRSRWVYERIHFDKTPIDVAILGSSRVEAAISAPILEQELTQKYGRPIHVANLAIPEEGRNLHYLVARELLESHPETRILLVSVVEQAGLSHYAFRYLGDPGDVVLGAAMPINHYYFLDAAFIPYRQMSYFVQTLFPSWFGVSRTFRKDYHGTDFDTTHSFYLPSGKLVDRSVEMPEDDLEAGSKHIVEIDGGPWHPLSRWRLMNEPLEWEYSRRLAEVAKAHCAETIFVRLPFFKSPENMYDAGFYRSLGPLLDAEELAGNPTFYQDPGHFNRNGTEQVTQWLWKSVQADLGPLDDARGCGQ